MALRPILVAPHPVLKAKAQPVETVDAEVRQMMDDMLETMYDAPGIGLAAPQIGVGSRVIVLDVAREDEPKAPMAMVNPELIWVSDEDASYEEGCLSVPEHYAEVVRPARIRVKYLDREGAKQELEADGLLATVIQHEMDHLDGILFIDHLSNLKRNMILRKLLKSRKQVLEEVS
jgi:peptide deformylase